VTFLVKELSDLGLTLPAAQAEKLVKGAVADVSRRLGISEQAARKYVRSEDVREIAIRMAVAVADERPGVAIVSEPRTLSVELSVLGRMIAALVEAAVIRSLAGDKDGAVQIMQLVSALGLILQEDGGSDTIGLPQAGLARAARLLETAADQVTSGAETLLADPDRDRDALSAALLSDVKTLRGLLSSRGLDGGPTPLS
jgi:hypothetical protein